MRHNDHLIRKITQARQRLLQAVEGLTEDQMAWVSDREWSIREILHHVAIAERANIELVERTVAGQPVNIDGFDLDAWNIAQVAGQAHLPAAEAIQALHDARDTTLDLLSHLSEDDLTRSLNHPGWGIMTVKQILRALSVHDTMHRRDIVRLVECFKVSHASEHK